MKWFTDMKIRFKLLTGFFVIIALMIALAFFATTQLKSVDDLNTYAFEYPGERQTAMLEFKSALRGLRRITATLAMYAPSYTENGDKIDDLVSNASDVYKEANDALDDYIKLVNGDDTLTKDDINDRIAKINSLKTDFDWYKTEITDVIVGHAKTGDYQGALDLIAEGSARILQASDASDALCETAKTSLDTAIANATSNMQRASTLILVITAIVAIIAIILALFISNLINKPLLRLTKLVGDVVGGNVNINMDRAHASKDEVGALTLDVYSLVDVIKKMIDDLFKLSDEINVSGDIEYRMNTGAYNGAYKDMLDSINSFVGTFVEDLLEILRGIGQLGSGNFGVKTKKQPGKKAVINEKFDAITANLGDIHDEVMKLVNSASEGNLEARVEAKRFKGGWGEIMTNLNHLLEAVVTPINEVNDVMSLVAVGDFSKKMAGNYKGDFLKIKNSINDTVANLESYINEITNVLDELAEDN
jgi:methyl-accepting chemotaxis protein